VRAKVHGTAMCPRLSVFRSLSSMYVQLIDDDASVTLASVSLKEKGVDAAKKAGEELAKKYVGECVFDRNGYRYHGRIKTFADAAREAGLVF
jgi:large subunit ribosomal protein L18